MVRMFKRVAALLCAVIVVSSAAFGQSAVSRVLFRVFLADGRVLSSYGEWSRIGDRVIFSMPTQLSGETIELQLVSIPAQQVDWPRTEQYALSVRAAAYGASRGDVDFAAFSSDVAKVLNDVSKIKDPAARLQTAEQARQRLADWPAQHYGYRNREVRDSLSVLDEVIAQMRVSTGVTRFDLSLSANAALPEPPPPPLPPPTDAELAEQFVAAASISETPAERIGLLQTVLRVLNRAIGMSSEWMTRMRTTVGADLAREWQTEEAYQELRRRSLQEAANLAIRGRTSDLEKLRDRVRAEDQRLGGKRSGEIASLLATIDLEAAAAVGYRDARREFDRRAPAFRRYRRSTNSAYRVYTDAVVALEQVRAMTGPPVSAIAPLTKRLDRANRGFRKVLAPVELASNHEMVSNALELADSAFSLRLQAVSTNNIDVAQRASSAAAGALMLYQRARAELLGAMERPSVK